MLRYSLVLWAVASLAAVSPAVAQIEVRQQIQVAPPAPGELPMFGPNRPLKTGTGRIRGRVVASESGTPLRRAQVRISGPDIGSKAALTDQDGRYEFRDLPAGRFNLSVSKSGFVTMQYGQNRPFEPGRPIELADAQTLDKANVTLPRGSVLSGRVLDEFGEPVADANVGAMRMQFVNGRRRLVNAGRNNQTNDLGQFRLYGLPPGEYYVSATLRSMDLAIGDMMAGTGGPVGSSPNSGYAPTYYPGTASPADAQRVTVAVGQELGSIDIALAPVKLAKITGTAMGSDGKPLAGAMIMLMPAMRDVMLFMPGATSRTSRDGQFTLVERRARRVLAPGALDGRHVHRHGRNDGVLDGDGWSWCSPATADASRSRVRVAARQRRGRGPHRRRGRHDTRGTGHRTSGVSRRREAGQPDERPRDRALSRP